MEFRWIDHPDLTNECENLKLSNWKQCKNCGQTPMYSGLKRAWLCRNKRCVFEVKDKSEITNDPYTAEKVKYHLLKDREAFDEWNIEQEK